MKIVATALAACLAIGPLAAAAGDKGHKMQHGEHAMAAKPHVMQPWARASVTRNGAAYMTIHNAGKAMDKLVAVRTPVAMRAELHTHSIDKGVMRMRKIEAIEVHPGTPAVLQPGGNHVMLMGLKQKLVEGTSFPLTLKFAKAGEVTVTVKVRGFGAKAPEGGMKGHKHTN